MELNDRILVTGGCGSVGSAVVQTLLSNHAALTISVLDHNERALFNMQQRFRTQSDRLEFVLADIRDRERLEQVLHGVDTVVHTAALKHVPLSETNPSEAIETNTIGTRQLITAAEKTNVEKVLTVSTDKAAQPSSVMGATKMLAERLITAANAESSETTYSTVRLGNVIGTSGSVVRIFERQIENGGPVTVTHPEMTRFMLPVSKAATFIVDALDRMSGGEVLVPKMEAMRIMDLADVMIERSGPANVDPADIDIEIVGIRPGERLHERLLTTPEARNTIELDESFIVTSQADVRNALVSDGGRELTTPYRSDEAEHLSLEEIDELLAKV